MSAVGSIASHHKLTIKDFLKKKRCHIHITPDSKNKQLDCDQSYSFLFFSLFFSNWFDQSYLGRVQEVKYDRIKVNLDVPKCM
jgi:hypothetical protein